LPCTIVKKENHQNSVKEGKKSPRKEKGKQGLCNCMKKKTITMRGLRVVVITGGGKGTNGRKGNRRKRKKKKREPLGI